MSECVVRMEMPRNCHECPMSCHMTSGAPCWCKLAFEKNEAVANGMMWKETDPFTRPDWCPILAVLPEKHGELIDRQAVYEKIKWWQENTHDTVTKAMLHEFYLLLFGVPTIVPAEAERSET